MRLRTNLTAIICFILISSAQGQILNANSLPVAIENIIKNLTFETAINKSKVFNTKKINSFEGDLKSRFYTVNIEKEYYPITTNYNMSIGYRFSKRHHVRLKYAENILGSILIGNIQIERTNRFSTSFAIDRKVLSILSKSIGIIYEYQIPYYEGSFVLGAGFERQKNWRKFETLIIPGILPRSFSFHSHFGYLAEINQFLHLHGKIFSTYYFSNNSQIYDSPIDSKYVPLQIGFEIGLRLNFQNAFPPRKQSKKRRRRKKVS